jgi:hypothetical protein
MVLIGIDPHKSTHTAVAVDEKEIALGKLTVKVDRHQIERLLKWAIDFPDRLWAIESANGLGHLLAQQLLRSRRGRSGRFTDPDGSGEGPGFWKVAEERPQRRALHRRYHAAETGQTLPVAVLGRRPRPGPGAQHRQGTSAAGLGARCRGPSHRQDAGASRARARRRQLRRGRSRGRRPARRLVAEACRRAGVTLVRECRASPGHVRGSRRTRAVPDVDDVAAAPASGVGPGCRLEGVTTPWARDAEYSPIIALRGGLVRGFGWWTAQGFRSWPLGLRVAASSVLRVWHLYLASAIRDLHIRQYLLCIFRVVTALAQLESPHLAEPTAARLRICPRRGREGKLARGRCRSVGRRHGARGATLVPGR